MSLEEWIISGIATGVLAIITGVIKYWIGKVKRHSERIASLENQLSLNEDRDKAFREGLDDKIEHKILKYFKK